MTRPGASLAPVTDDAEQAAADLTATGCARLRGVLAPSLVERLRGLVEVRADAERRAGTAYLYSAGDTNQRVWTLVGGDTEFLDLVEQSTARHVLGAALGAEVLLSNLSANIAGPGGTAMVPHWDQDWAPRPWPHALVAHVIWMLDDFTEENGATLVAPGSHLLGPDEPAGGLAAATGQSGTALFLDGRVWHGTGPNTATRRRSGLLAYYCRPYVRQQENYALSLAASVQESLTRSQRALLGLDFWEYLNMVGGPPSSLDRY